MILSNTAEFIPWVIQPQKENHFTEISTLQRVTDASTGNYEVGSPSLENINKDEDAAQGPELDENIIDDEESVTSQDYNEHNKEEVIPPELLPKYTSAEFNEHGEAEFLRGYNSCKENEQLEFSGRLEQLKESKDSISKIVTTILEEITRESDGSVRLFLSPRDTSLLADFEPNAENPVKILSDPRLATGSARAVMGDSIIESMRENRVQQIVDQIMGETQKKTVSRVSKKNVSKKKGSVRKKA